jgi:hypothetical protein
MRLRKTGKGLLLVAILALGAAPYASAAEEEFVVPPENSAAHQYTEAFPTSGGDRDVHAHRGRDLSPDKVIGAKNANRLNQQGPDGQATAELAAETAPRILTFETTSAGDATPAAGGDSGSGAAAGGGQGGDSGAGNAGLANSAPVDAGGSSGFSGILSSATGSSGGSGMGIFLPLLILASIAWAIAYSVRQRQPIA